MAIRNQTITSSQAFGLRGRAGAKGEADFFRALSLAKHPETGVSLADFTVFRSLDIPASPGYRGDVDLVIANGDRAVLVDVKRWSGRAPYWTLPGTSRPMRGALPLREQGRWRLSHNMWTALDRYRAVLRDTPKLSAMVAFVPTSARDPESVPSSVRILRWPGGIGSYLAGAAFEELFRRLGTSPQEIPSSTARILSGLERH
jgi:hypothetical protein